MSGALNLLVDLYRSCPWCRANSRNIVFAAASKLLCGIGSVLMGGVVIGAAGLLGVSGLYALVSFTVERRTLEIGIRRVLGAQPSNVALIVIRKAMLQLGVGVVIGGALGMVGVRWFAGRVWAETPNWPAILAVLIELVACS